MTQQEREYLDSRFAGLTKLMDAQFINVHDRLEEIKIQTTKTNGRVNSLEEDVSLLEKNLPHTQATCPQKETIEDLKKWKIATEAIRVNWVKTIALISLVVGIIYSLAFLSFKVSEKRQANATVQQSIR